MSTPRGAGEQATRERMRDELKPSVIRTAHEYNVSIVDPLTGTVSCDTCGREWTIPIQPGAEMPKRWWACPGGCNV